jgi:hypothetical protein
MDSWAGRVIVLFVVTADFRGKMGPALRVRIPPPKNDYGAPPVKRPKPPVEAEADDFDEPELLDDDLPEAG